MSDRLSTIAAVASSVAAVCALIVSCQERDTPYRAALYSARWSALEQYVKASTEFQSALRQTILAVPGQVDDPEVFSRLSDDQLYIIAKAASPISGAWWKYLESHNAAMAPFSDQTIRVVENAREAGNAAIKCLVYLGSQYDYVKNDHAYWERLKKAAAPACSGLHQSSAGHNFHLAANAAITAMTVEISTESDDFIPGRAYRSGSLGQVTPPAPR